jgi:hypothetical protein
MTTGTERSYDSKCLELAEYFAEDENFSEHELDQLASDIQDTVESFFSWRQSQAEAAYDRAQEEPTFRGNEYGASIAAALAEARKLK